MTPTVHELRNAVRVAVDRFERVDSTSFTKETLVAVCTAVGADLDVRTTTPPTREMRAAIRRATGVDPEATAETAGGSFRKAELQTIADAVEADVAE